ncbi:polysaccharide pyruvyl transferase family protein, partial [Acinetobacter baumannii]|uniref:polysaccharide pyruvyl transferase family protein n=1 Tax=Acinetobacter baumannii TaxID=470 RepID=UPI0037CA4E08
TRVDRCFRQPTEIVDTYSQFDLVIATRMHAAILALLAGTPVIGIAYEFKLEELFSQLGMAHISLPIGSIDPNLANETVLYGVRNLER